jgi:hypothetical protein
MVFTSHTPHKNCISFHTAALPVKKLSALQSAWSRATQAVNTESSQNLQQSGRKSINLVHCPQANIIYACVLVVARSA